MGNQVAIALARASGQREAEQVAGVSVTNMHQNTKSATLINLELEHVNLRAELHDHARIIGQMEALGQRASEQEYGVFKSGNLLRRGFWTRTTACEAIRDVYGTNTAGIAVKPIGKATRASRAISVRHAEYRGAKRTLDRLERTIKAVKGVG